MVLESELLNDLLDEGLITDDLAAEILSGNWSIENAIPESYQRADLRCSVSQASLSGWSWLIGSSGGALQPLLCRARRRDACEASDIEQQFLEETKGTDAVFAVGILFGLANLITMAVWFRCKAPANHREVSIQLLLLRALCLTGFVGLIAEWLHPWWPVNLRTRVLGVFHAVLVAVALNSLYTIRMLCYKLNIALGFLTSIYLVEHSHVAQRVLLFVSQRRTQILVGAATAICLVLSFQSFLKGYIYCVNASTGISYILHDSYLRGGVLFYHILAVVLIPTFMALMLLTIILLIVYASKRCCACCRGSAPAADTSVTVAYVRQLESPADEAVPPETAVVTELGTQVPQGFQLADELRRLIFWQLVSETVLRIFLFLVLHALRTINMGMILTLMAHILEFNRLAIWSLILSPTYRSSFVSLFVELRNAAAGFIGGMRRPAGSAELMQSAE